MPTLKTDLALALPVLTKAVFSQPTPAASWTRLSVRPVKLKNRLVFQTEASGTTRPTIRIWTSRGFCNCSTGSWTAATARF